MALLTSGYWPSAYWPGGFWADDYWPDYADWPISRELVVGITHDDLTIFVTADNFEIIVIADNFEIIVGDFDMSDILELKQGEGKWIKFVVTRNDGSAVDLSPAVSLTFGVKYKLQDLTYLYFTVSFDMSSAVDGIVRVNIPATVTSDLEVRDYDAELKIIFAPDTDVDKSQRLTIRIKPAVIHD